MLREQHLRNSNYYIRQLMQNSQAIFPLRITRNLPLAVSPSSFSSGSQNLHRCRTPNRKVLHHSTRNHPQSRKQQGRRAWVSQRWISLLLTRMSRRSYLWWYHQHHLETVLVKKRKEDLFKVKLYLIKNATGGK